MTIQELIAHLSTMPPDALVLVADWNEEYAPPLAVSRDEVSFIRNRKFSLFADDYKTFDAGDGLGPCVVFGHESRCP
jgi:hypothetical protein